MRKSSMLLSILLSFLTLSADAGRTKDLTCGYIRDCVIPYNSEGNQNGTETCYEDDSRKVKIREITWKDGQREGKARCFDKNQMSKEVTYKNDIMNGPFVEYNYDSNGDRVTLMENGEEAGLSFSVSKGKVSAVHYCLVSGNPERGAILSCSEKDYGSFNPLLKSWMKEEKERNKLATGKEEKRRNGPQESRYSSGKLRSKWNHVDGSIHGKFLSYTEAGILKTDCEYKNGKLEGICLGYDDDGRLDKKETWKDRKLVKEETFFDNGNPEQVMVMEGDKKFCYITYYDNKQKMSEWCEAQRHREGPYTQWDSEGNLYFQGNFEKGFRTGTWEYYDGKEISSEHVYEKGILVKSIDYLRTPPQHRIVREYFPDGSIKKETRLEGLLGNQKHLI